MFSFWGWFDHHCSNTWFILNKTNVYRWKDICSLCLYYNHGRIALRVIRWHGPLSNLITWGGPGLTCAVTPSVPESTPGPPPAAWATLPPPHSRKPRTPPRYRTPQTPWCRSSACAGAPTREPRSFQRVRESRSGWARAEADLTLQTTRSLTPFRLGWHCERGREVR